MREQTVSKIREFNRFYMPVFDLLGNRYLGSQYSATEARVLFEIYDNEGCNAAHIARQMNIDKSYLSRIIKKYENNGYIVKRASKADSRSLNLYLTDKGLEKTENLIVKSNLQIGSMIENLGIKDCNKLIESFDTIICILEKCQKK